MGFFTLQIGFIIGWLAARKVNSEQLERVVAMSWGDGKYGRAFYGAHVYLHPISSGYSVRAQVLIGRHNGYYHQIGELGRVSHPADAVEKWGTIQWREDGVQIGTGTNGYFLPRAKLERHR